MDCNKYKEAGKQVVDYIANYFETIRERRVFPDVEPGYIRKLLPNEAPNSGEQWKDIFEDVDNVIMPGITHWQSPHMHAYFPALNSFPSLLGEMISEAINCISFTWASSPAATELESLIMDWLVKMLGLPGKFLHSNIESSGGGVLQTSVSESTYYALLAARTKMFHKFSVGDLDKYTEKSELNGKLICYCSSQAHSSVEKSALVALIRIKILPVDDDLSLRGNILQEEIKKDREQGLIPFFVCATLGTTGACSFDNLKEIGEICSREDLWLHIDAAYAGTSFLCPEYRHFMSGIEHANSFVFNASKWMMVNFDCACFWVDSAQWLHQTFTVTPLYLSHKYSSSAIDYMNWQVGLSRRFRALKLWFVIRTFGINGLQEHVRKGVQLAKLFEDLVIQDKNFEMPAKRHLGLVVFRLKGENEITEFLLKNINKDGRLHVVPASVKNLYVIRFTVTSQNTTEDDIRRDWDIIRQIAYKIILNRKRKLEFSKFQSSLVLSNVPCTPKFVNSSFLAFLNDSDIIYNILKDLESKGYNESKIPVGYRHQHKVLHKRLSCGIIKNEVVDAKSTMKASLLKWALSERKNELKQQTSLDSKIDNIFEQMEIKKCSNSKTQNRIVSTSSNEKSIKEDDENCVNNDDGETSIVGDFESVILPKDVF